MRTQEIPKKEWTEFFDNFSRKHEGWLVSLEIFGPEIGAQVEERELALEGITAALDQTEGNTIMIMTGIKPNDHITHSVTGPTSVSLEQTDEGADAALAIKSEDGLTTLLRFRSAVLPEMVDAVAG
jgi:uncharacterized protein DUF5335